MTLYFLLSCTCNMSPDIWRILCILAHLWIESQDAPRTCMLIMARMIARVPMQLWSGISKSTMSEKSSRYQVPSTVQTAGDSALLLSKSRGSQIGQTKLHARGNADCKFHTA